MLTVKVRIKNYGLGRSYATIEWLVFGEDNAQLTQRLTHPIFQRTQKNGLTEIRIVGRPLPDAETIYIERPLIIEAHGAEIMLPSFDTPKKIDLNSYFFQYQPRPGVAPVPAPFFSLISFVGERGQLLVASNAEKPGMREYHHPASTTLSPLHARPLGLPSHSPTRPIPSELQIPGGYFERPDSRNIMLNYLLTEDYVADRVFIHDQSWKGRLAARFGIHRFGQYLPGVGATTGTRDMYRTVQERALASGATEMRGSRTSVPHPLVAASTSLSATDIFFVESGNTSLYDVLQFLFYAKIHYKEIRVDCCRGKPGLFESKTFDLEKPGVELTRRARDDHYYRQLIERKKMLESLLPGMHTTRDDMMASMEAHRLAENQKIGKLRELLAHYQNAPEEMQNTYDLMRTVGSTEDEISALEAELQNFLAQIQGEVTRLESVLIPNTRHEVQILNSEIQKLQAERQKLGLPI